jgi:hypothetical protein
MKKSKPTQYKKSSRNSGLIIFLSIVAVLVILLIVVNALSNEAASKGKDFLDHQVEIGVESFPSEGDAHTEGPVSYDTFPPTSGPHSATPAGYGFYETAPPFENLVHSLEHGDIVIYYQPTLPEAQLDELRELAAITFQGSGVLAVPNADIAEPVVATAWTKMMKLSSFDRTALEQFMYDYLYEGPEKLPPH